MEKVKPFRKTIAFIVTKEEHDALNKEKPKGLSMSEWIRVKLFGQKSRIGITKKGD